jgi:hypothetical protein
MLIGQNFKGYFDVRTFGEDFGVISVERFCQTITQAAEETITIDLVSTQKPEEPDD